MTIEPPAVTDKLVRVERRGIWLSLTVVLLLVVVLKGIAHGEAKENRQAMMQDEFRQIALRRACKTAFFSLLGALAVFVAACAAWPIALSARSMAAAMVAFGTVVFLAAFLFFDGGVAALNERFSNQLKIRRAEKDLTQAELADVVGTTRK